MRKELVSHINKLDNPAIALHALEYAENVHRKQSRPSSEGRVPYIGHLMSVAHRLIGFGVKDSSVIAGSLLHDAVEDQAFKILADKGINVSKPLRVEESLKVLSGEFSPYVSELVGILTNPELPKELSKAEKRVEYQTHVRDILAGNQDAALIKMSDYLDNAGRILDSIDNPGRAFHFHAKYAPLVDDFIVFAESFPDKKISERASCELKNAKMDMEKALEELQK